MRLGLPLIMTVTGSNPVHPSLLAYRVSESPYSVPGENGQGRLFYKRLVLRCFFRQKSLDAGTCGPDAPTLASSWWSDPLMTVTNKPGQRGEPEGNR
jgi:hypothetical protein